jgi:hypothetical protein
MCAWSRFITGRGCERMLAMGAGATFLVMVAGNREMQDALARLGAT